MGHVTEEQRYTIEVMLKAGHLQKHIAIAIGKHKSVVSREINRNIDKRSGEYRKDLAQRKYNSRLSQKPKAIKFTEEIRNKVEQKLELKWSPEQISNSKDLAGKISHERIYQHIIADKKLGGNLYTHLRRKRKYKRRVITDDRRGKIIDAKNIKQRPSIVDEKKRVGDFEVDLVIGSNHKGALVTMNDRSSGLAKIRLVKSKDANKVAQAIVKALKPIKEHLHTITSDNGKEFSKHKYIAHKLGIDFYFADPYSSWQRGANENLNGLIRQYFPKKTNFEELTWIDVKKVEKQINNRPRKRLGFISPIEKFNLSTKVAFKT